MQLSLVLGFFLHLWTSCSRCEGRHVTWDVSGSMACAIENAPGIGHLQKRALKRAYARAQRCGGAWYRNQWLTTPLMASAEPPSMKWKPMTRASQPKGRRLKVFSWNVRSLTMELWADVQAYIQCQGFDIVTLQSTGWSFESSWRAAGYNIIHSGDPGDPQGGAMILIAQTIGSSEDISYSSLLLGRILHVRVKTPQVTLDVLSCYQHPWRPGQSQEDNLQARSKVWDTLHESLSALPFRNRLILAGDFNSSLVTEVGADHLEFKRLVKHHHLDSLLSSTPTVPTYYSPQGNTQIDYVFGRRCQLDANARCGVVDLQCPLASWREALDHRPLVCQMPQAWRPWRRKPPPVIAQQKLRDHLRNMKCQAPETWQTLCTQLADNFGRLPTQIDSLSHIHDVTLAKANQSYIVPVHVPSGPAPGGLKHLWTKHQELLRSKPATLGQIFRKWTLWSDIQRTRRTLRRTCKQRKRHRIEQKIHEATTAYRQRDPYRMYKVVRELAPKAPFKQVHLRNQYGLAQDPAQELDAIAAFFADLCQGGEWTYSTGPLPDLPFTCEDLEHSLALTPSAKSVAPGTCPGLLVKALAPHLAPWLYELLTNAWTQGTMLHIPPAWRNAWVTCVPKRTIKAPRDIRPIALQCPIGKAVLRTNEQLYSGSDQMADLCISSRQIHRTSLAQGTPALSQCSR